MKDPAFLFYSSDFLSGTMLMNDEEVGQYIRLLCLQHQKGHLREKDMLNICKEYNEDIFCKFIKDEEGRYYNKRLEEEVLKRKKYSESRRNNRKKKNTEDTIEKDMNNICETYEKDMKKICNSYKKHMGNENENENININENINENVKKEEKHSAKANKHKYGEYKNVLLKDEELQKLKEEYANWQELITYLDEYIEMKGYKAKSHYLCIKKWVVDAVKNKQKKNTVKQGQRDYSNFDWNSLYTNKGADTI